MEDETGELNDVTMRIRVCGKTGFPVWRVGKKAEQPESERARARTRAKAREEERESMLWEMEPSIDFSLLFSCVCLVWCSEKPEDRSPSKSSRRFGVRRHRVRYMIADSSITMLVLQTSIPSSDTDIHPQPIDFERLPPTSVFFLEEFHFLPHLVRLLRTTVIVVKLVCRQTMEEDAPTKTRLIDRPVNRLTDRSMQLADPPCVPSAGVVSGRKGQSLTGRKGTGAYLFDDVMTR